LNSINKVAKEYSLNINLSKTKLMIVNYQRCDNAIFYISRLKDQINLNISTLNDKWNSDGEMEIKAAIAKAIFIGFDKYVLRQTVSVSLKLCDIKCYI